MIKLVNLSKTYVTNDVQIKALKNISCFLPSKGIVFVIGKSGSGKTTLMNLIGGLDFVSEGQIFVDGNEISSFNESEYENYRNSHVGFIFQDFFLLSNLTVKENIEVSLKLQNKQVNELEINKLLNAVDLDGLANRYPNELSGGQKQRVAIARALVKKPSIILADEPTGNLDSGTAIQILDVLKEFSKEVLVLIVSHNIQEAQKYADRIIKIDKGEIIEDIQRINNFDKSLIVGNTINFPYNIKLSKKQLESINELSKTGDYKLSQDINVFEPCENIVDDQRNIQINDYQMNTASLLKFNKKIQKNSIKGSIATAFAVSLLLILLMISMVFANYQYAPLVKQIMQDNNDYGYVLRKSEMSDSIIPELKKNTTAMIDDEEIESIYEQGYKGNIYKFYNKTITTSLNNYLVYEPEFGGYEKAKVSPYRSIGIGVLECDLDYLNQLYGNGNNVKILAGSIDDSFKPYGYILPDYMADTIIFKNASLKELGKEEAYNKIVELDSIYNSYTVKAIFETGYRNRYKNVFKAFIDYSNNPTDANKKRYEDVLGTDEYLKFVDECDCYLGIAYYIGDLSVIEAIMTNTNSYHKYLRFINSRIYIPESDKLISGAPPVATNYSYYDENINSGEIYLNYYTYNSYFNKSLTNNNYNDFEEKEVTINIYDVSDFSYKNAIYQKTFKVVGILNDKYKHIQYGLSKEDFNDLIQYSVYPSALYFDNVDSITKIYSPNINATKLYYPSNNCYDAVYEVASIFMLFESLFTVFSVVLVISSIVLMVSHIKRNIKNKTYEIGVLKGIGLKNSYVFKMYFYKLISLITSILIATTLSLFFFDKLINSILINNLDVMLPNTLKDKLIFFEFDSVVVLVIYVLIIMLSLTTTFILISSLKKIKPIDIIKADDD